MSETDLAKIISDKNIKIILQVLAANEVSAYQIQKQAGMKHATVHKKLKEALKAKLIEVKSESKFRTGLPTKTYMLTPSGLVCYLYYYFIHCLVNERKPEISLSVSEKISQLLFEQWQKFLKYVPEGYALLMLINTLVHLLSHIEKVNNDSKKMFLEEFIAHLCMPAHEHPELTYPAHTHPLWEGDPPWNEIVAFLNSEPELKVMFAKKVSMTIESLKNSLIYWQKIQEKIQV